METVAYQNGTTPHISSSWQVQEAPASCCLKFTQEGVGIMYTMRDVNDEALFPRVKRVLARLKGHKEKEENKQIPQHENKQWCPIHETWMKQYTKGSRTWFAHKVGDTWCHGK